MTVVAQKPVRDRDPAVGEAQLRRVRRICAALPQTTENLSHGEPTFFVRKRVYTMYANNHHNDGHIAVWIPAETGLQEMLVQSEPKKFFKPPYVGVKGWIGIELEEVDDDKLGYHISQAWRLTAPKKLQTLPFVCLGIFEHIRRNLMTDG
jgi:hypothetical protein